MTVNALFWIVLIGLIAISFYKGKSTLVTTIVSMYPSMIVYRAFIEFAEKNQFKDIFLLFKTNSWEIFISHLIIFFVIFVILFFTMRKFGMHVETGDDSKKVKQSIWLSVGVLCLIVLLCFHILPDRDLFGFSKNMEIFVNSPIGYLVLTILPIWALRMIF